MGGADPADTGLARAEVPTAATGGYEIYVLQASVLRTLASPRRLEILHRLGRGAASVRQLATELRISQPNLSAHLSSLRAVGLVDAERDGREVRYRLADPETVVACGMLREVLSRRLVRLGALVAAARDADDDLWRAQSLTDDQLADGEHERKEHRP